MTDYQPAPARPDIKAILSSIEEAKRDHGTSPQRQTLESLCRWIEYLERPRTPVDHEEAHNAVRRLTHLLEHFESEADNDSDAEDLAEDLKWIVEDMDAYVAACRDGHVYTDEQARTIEAVAMLSRCEPSEVNVDPLGNVSVTLWDGDAAEHVHGEHHESVVEAIFDAVSYLESENPEAEDQEPEEDED